MDLKLFFSWQEETNLQGFNNKNFLIDCINSAIKEIQGKGDLKGIRIIFDEGLLRSPGTPEVALEMFKKIDECDIFIADMTVVQRMLESFEEFRNKEGFFFRYSPNCNVFGEYNRALGKSRDFYKQIILLMNKANKEVLEDITVIPFDTRGRRWPILFTLTDESEEAISNAKDELMKVLPNAIRLSALAARDYVNERYYPFVTWYTQIKDGNLNLSFIKDEIVNKYRPILLSDSKIVRVIGPVDKNILVLKACNSTEVANCFLYVDSVEYKYDEYKEALNKIFKNYKDAIVVVDKCSNEDFKRILKIRGKHKAGNRVISLSSSEIESYVSDDKITVLDVNDVVNTELNERMQEYGIVDNEIQDQVKSFFGKDSKLIEFVTENLTGAETSQDFELKGLLTKLIASVPGSVERTIMQSLALFDSIGWKEERIKELEFILWNKAITNLDIENSVLLNEAIAIIKNNIRRGTIIEKGRTISVSPKELALQLQTEWLDNVNEVRLLTVLTEVQKTEFGKGLIREFHDRFKFLGDSQDARDIVHNILKVGSVFENIDVLNTEEGSMLIHSFTEVNPEAVADLLSRTLNVLPTDKLLLIEKGRRYLVWALEKICFKKETFAKGAYLMLRFAKAENEDISNNATGQFKTLFPIQLPATAATLGERFSFIKEYIQCEEFKNILIDALSVALKTRDFILFSGAEKFGDKTIQYDQPSAQEVFDYQMNCLNLLKAEIVENTSVADKAYMVIENRIIGLCDYNRSYNVISFADEISQTRNYDWDSLQETLARFKDVVWKRMNKQTHDLYDVLLGKLTKNDPISRFKRMEKESLYASRNISYNVRYENQREAYKQLAYEFYEGKIISKENLRELINATNINSDPFGETLAELMSEEEHTAFLRDYVDILLEGRGQRIDILCNFIKGLDEGAFEKAIPLLMKSPVPSTIFACLGTRATKPNNANFGLMKKQIEEGKSTVDDYIQYWTRIPIGAFNEGDMLSLFEVVSQFENSLPIILRMGSYLLFSRDSNQFKQIEVLIEHEIIAYDKDSVSLLYMDNALHVAGILMKDGSKPELAKKINDAIIKFAEQSDVYFSPSYEMEQIYRLMMDKYFDSIWPTLSVALLSSDEEFMTYYHLKNLLGPDMVYEESLPIIMEGGHFEDMLAWCEKNTEIAPARLASMIPVANSNDQFTPEALALIDRYADKKYVLDELGASLDSFASVGSIVPYYERRRNIYSTLLKHKNESVRRWAQRQINSCDYMIQRESTLEQEKW